MRTKRTNKDFGGGSGRGIFESELFRVVVWSLGKGIKTTISCQQGYGMEISFEGTHNFTTDKLCIEQLNPSEILRLLKWMKEESFEQGQDSKAAEIKKCLGIHSR